MDDLKKMLKDMKTLEAEAAATFSGTMIKGKPGLTRLSQIEPLEPEGERIVVGVPPNYPKILAAFPQAAKTHGVIFAYGSTIFNRDGVTIPKPIAAHELCHLDQQKVAGGAEAWWDRYMVDVEWRYGEELQAHQVEYFYATLDASRLRRRAYLSAIAKRLSGPLYGHMTTLEKAKQAIKGALR